MQLALVSDIHGNLPALQAVLADARALGVQQVANLGDIVSGPLWPAETVAWLMSGAARGWPTLAGNHERQVLAAEPRAPAGDSDRRAWLALSPVQRAWLRALPPALWLAEDLAACHGTPLSDLHYLLETVDPAAPAGVRAATAAEAAARLGPTLAGRPLHDAALLVCGHSHMPRVLALPDGRLLANPGSVGLPAFDDEHPHPHDMATGSPQARYAIAERGAEGWRVHLRAVDYDVEAAARRADAQGRGDWADALRTGRVGRREADVLRPAPPGAA